ncbi:MAG: hypothetical protein QNI84_02730 [Henriciella sp.]|nr:hypothetical protein [Henriciella sp.]
MSRKILAWSFVLSFCGVMSAYFLHEGSRQDQTYNAYFILLSGVFCFKAFRLHVLGQPYDKAEDVFYLAFFSLFAAAIFYNLLVP